MSFSGFVFDMIRRNKENRDLLTLRRERMKDLQGKMYRKGTLQNPNVTLEELEKIEKATREKEKSGNTILSARHTDLPDRDSHTGTHTLVDIVAPSPL